MATTTNYGWTTPDDTDLVKDGAAAIRTLGSSVDTTTKNLNPETTLGDMSFRSATSNVNTRLPIGSSGQHLTVVAGVPAWATASDQTPLTTKGDLFTFSTVDARLGVGTNDHRLVAASGEATGLKYVSDTQNTVVDAEGDLLVGDAADALQRLAIGSNAQVLTVDTTVDGKIKWATPAGGGGGKVLQVVYATYGTQVNSTTSTYADTNLTATITPTLNTSKVLVIVNQNGCEKRQTDTSMMLKLLRGATDISQMASLGGYTGTTVDLNFGSISTAVLDAPATTSATTYKTQFASNGNTSRVSVQHGDGGAGGSVSTITLLEIGA